MHNTLQAKLDLQSPTAGKGMPRASSQVATLDHKMMRSWYALMAAGSKPVLQKPVHHLPGVQFRSTAGPRAGTSHLRTELSPSLLPVVSSWRLDHKYKH